jgi:hypothetical protein
LSNGRERLLATKFRENMTEPYLMLNLGTQSVKSPSLFKLGHDLNEYASKVARIKGDHNDEGG